jgi:hypothetical protein
MKRFANLARHLLHGRTGWLRFSALVACSLQQSAGVATELMGPAICRGVAALALVAAAAPARSELPPWVYGDDQRQGKGLTLRPGSAIEIVFNRPPAQPMGWTGPSPIPVLSAGTRTLAWLSPLPNQEPTRFPPQLTMHLRHSKPLEGAGSDVFIPAHCLKCEK